MATAKKLPSGSYRVQIFSHFDSTGKKVYKSFTAITKREAELQAAEYKIGRKEAIEKDWTVKEAVEKYIQANENILSPATLYGYECELKRMESIHHIRISRLKSHNVQLFISELAEKYSAKTVKNTYGLLVASVAHFNPDFHIRVNLPRQGKKRLYAPNSEDVMRLYNAASPKLKLCIALAAFHSFRRGEIAALKFGDVKGNKLHVHSDMVYGRDRQRTYKEYPKTEDSDRFAILPPQVIQMIGSGAQDDYIIGWKPNSITKRFEELAHKLNITIRFHDLRHYFASIGAIIGVPDTYLASMGGWKADGSVMKSIYQNKIISMEEAYSKKMNDYFSEMIK